MDRPCEGWRTKSTKRVEAVAEANPIAQAQDFAPYPCLHAAEARACTYDTASQQAGYEYAQSGIDYEPSIVGVRTGSHEGSNDSGQSAAPGLNGQSLENSPYHAKPFPHFAGSYFPPIPKFSRYSRYGNMPGQVPGLSMITEGGTAVQVDRIKHRRGKFPVKFMHALVEFPNQEALTWLPSGEAFVILNPDLFVAEILSKVCNVIKYPSFVRKLNRWGFTRLPSRSNTDCFWHPCFSILCPEKASLVNATTDNSKRTTGSVAQAHLPPHDDRTDAKQPSHPVWVEAVNRARGTPHRVPNVAPSSSAPFAGQDPFGPPLLKCTESHPKSAEEPCRFAPGNVQGSSKQDQADSRLCEDKETYASATIYRGVHNRHFSPVEDHDVSSPSKGTSARFHNEPILRFTFG